MTGDERRTADSAARGKGGNHGWQVEGLVKRTRSQIDTGLRIVEQANRALDGGPARRRQAAKTLGPQELG